MLGVVLDTPQIAANIFLENPVEQKKSSKSTKFIFNYKNVF